MSSSNYFCSWIDRPHLDPNTRLLTEEYQRGITEFMGLVHRQPEAKTEVLTAQLKDKDDRISLLETQMAAQQAGYEAQRRLNQQMMEMMQRMYPNEVFPNVPDP
ncbi:hypothetical protein DY000_02023942 [Brassica cretica]|uniref:Uncharacterized protein n=1 Tax=Brassica cretica TaxID=69181 RepID=A0ABQ7E864_BRACR|nr:hypothetical protein DY000_02023942 [Brassica cretica]